MQPQTKQQIATKFSGSFWISLENVVVLYSKKDAKLFPTNAAMQEFNLEQEPASFLLSADLGVDQKLGKEEKGKQEELVLFWIQKSFFCQMLRILFSQKYLVGFISRHNFTRSQILGALEQDQRLVELQNKLLGDTENFVFLSDSNTEERHKILADAKQSPYLAIDTYLFMKKWLLNCRYPQKNIFYGDAKRAIDDTLHFNIDGIESDLVIGVNDHTPTKKFNKSPNCLSAISDFLFPQFLGLAKDCLVLNLDYVKISDYFSFGVDDSSRKKSCGTVIANLASAKYLQNNIQTQNKYILKIMRDRDAKIKEEQDKLVSELMNALSRQREFPNCQWFLLRAVENYQVYLSAIKYLEEFQQILNLNSVIFLEEFVAGGALFMSVQAQPNKNYESLLREFISTKWVKLFIQLTEKAVELRERWFNNDPVAAQILSDGLDICSGHILEFTLNNLFKLKNLQELSRENTLAKLNELKNNEVLKRYRPVIECLGGCCCRDQIPSTIKLITDFYQCFSEYTLSSVHHNKQKVTLLKDGFNDEQKAVKSTEQKATLVNYGSNSEYKSTTMVTAHNIRNFSKTWGILSKCSLLY